MGGVREGRGNAKRKYEGRKGGKRGKNVGKGVQEKWKLERKHKIRMSKREGVAKCDEKLEYERTKKDKNANRNM